jgi:uncharacterized repeat protein (TIGR02543 family)
LLIRRRRKRIMMKTFFVKTLRLGIVFSVPDKVRRRNLALIAAAVFFAGCPATTDPGASFVPVSGIKDVPLTGVAGTELDLSGARVIPDNATHQAIDWAVVKDGGTGVSTAGIVNNKFTPSAAGSLIVSAGVENGKAEGLRHTQEFTILIEENSDTPADIAWTATTDGAPGTATSTTLFFVFSEALSGLSADSIAVTGAAEKDSNAALSGSGAAWELSPIIVSAAGTASVTITQAGIEGKSHQVTVHKQGDEAPFVAVTDITGVPATAALGEALALAGAVEPDNATNQTIAWSVRDPGATGAVISEGKLTATAAGEARVAATIANGAAEGAPFTKEFTIVVSGGEDPAPHYTVSFDSNGGSEVPSQTIVRGGKASEPPGTVKNGYALEGWHREAALAAKWNFDTDTVSGAMTLYAKWTPVTYAIVYELNGGANAAGNPAAYTIESAGIALADPSRAGYIFGGWFDNSGFAGPAITAIAAGSVGSKTFYAGWSESGPVGIAISYWVNEQDRISSSAGAASVSKTGGPLTIAADGGGYSDQHWYVNGVEDPSKAGQSSYTFSAAGKDTKTYTIGLRVKKDNQYYFAHFAVTVTD